MSLAGEQLGHYRLLRLLGSGGMGEVYLAEDARIGQRVAIKVIRSEDIAYPGSESAKEAARLFEREAKAIARLDHPNILPLYAYGEEKLGEQELTYLVMPYRKEGTLATWLRLRGSTAPLSPAEIAPLLQQAAAALQHAHDQQVLHQDIKPSNILIRLRSDQPELPDLLLSDFGIAKLTGATASASQSIRGTPTYMPPEQWEGQPVQATDQYALAIMAYELLAGRPPFQGGPGQVMRQHYLIPPPVPSTLNPQLSPAVDAVLLRALSKQPEDRFPSVIAFSQAFQEAVQNSGELRATLAISRAEAETGTIRQVTLPGGRQVNISVPAGVVDGTNIHLEGQGMPYYKGGPAGLLIMTISIPEGERPLSLRQENMESTVPQLVPDLQTSPLEDKGVSAARPYATAIPATKVPSRFIEITRLSLPLATRRLIVFVLSIVVLTGGIALITFHPASQSGINTGTHHPNVSEENGAQATAGSGINQFPVVDLTKQASIIIDIINAPLNANCSPACFAVANPTNSSQMIISPNIKVKVATKITWVNRSSTIHTVTAIVGENPMSEVPAPQLFDSGLATGIAPNGTFTYTVAPSTYNFNSNHVVVYYCQYHPNMVAAITVTQ